MRNAEHLNRLLLRAQELREHQSKLQHMVASSHTELILNRTLLRHNRELMQHLKARVLETRNRDLM
ncbi:MULTISPECIES: hypothetical protein [Paenibacillus]|uniref:hypothetical protein n=1 Tax=Paenibacillus TaxID=44249 RepID=UPI0022B8FA3B|nr:hypothetical protein [Paenibacillus caseinilyticus]MCZ8518640.1 hypothetical protein [Paenibacillus caseinilyticus]